MTRDIEGARVPYPPRAPRSHAHGRLTCWGPKVIVVHRSRLAARLDAFWHRVRA